MTPFELQFILHYHSSGEDIRGGDFSAPIMEETVERFIGDGLIERTSEDERATDKHPMKLKPTVKLHAFVELLCRTPLPQLVWVDPAVSEKVGLWPPNRNP